MAENPEFRPQPSESTEPDASTSSKRIRERLLSGLKVVRDRLAPDTTPPPHFTEFANNLSNGLFPEDHKYYGLPTGGQLSDGGYKKSGGVEKDWYEVKVGENQFLYPLSYTPDDAEIVVGQPIWVDPNMDR
jgi:hypothetical protein